MMLAEINSAAQVKLTPISESDNTNGMSEMRTLIEIVHHNTIPISD